MAEGECKGIDKADNSPRATGGTSAPGQDLKRPRAAKTMKGFD